VKPERGICFFILLIPVLLGNASETE
jgi:hypothetical protein